VDGYQIAKNEVSGSQGAAGETGDAAQDSRGLLKKHKDKAGATGRLAKDRWTSASARGPGRSDYTKTRGEGQARKTEGEGESAAPSNRICCPGKLKSQKGRSKGGDFCTANFSGGFFYHHHWVFATEIRSEERAKKDGPARLRKKSGGGKPTAEEQAGTKKSKTEGILRLRGLGQIGISPGNARNGNREKENLNKELQDIKDTPKKTPSRLTPAPPARTALPLPPHIKRTQLCVQR